MARTASRNRTRRKWPARSGGSPFDPPAASGDRRGGVRVGGADRRGLRAALPVSALGAAPGRAGWMARRRVGMDGPSGIAVLALVLAGRRMGGDGARVVHPVLARRRRRRFHGGARAAARGAEHGARAAVHAPVRGALGGVRVPEAPARARRAPVRRADQTARNRWSAGSFAASSALDAEWTSRPRSITSARSATARANMRF